MTLNENYVPKITKQNILRATVEIGFILILFYSNLLMGEFTRSGEGFKKGFPWAVLHIFTPVNLVIALITACIAYFIVEYLRRKVQEDGDLVATRTSLPLEHSEEELTTMRDKAGSLAAKFRTEMLQIIILNDSLYNIDWSMQFQPSPLWQTKTMQVGSLECIDYGIERQGQNVFSSYSFDASESGAV